MKTEDMRPKWVSIYIGLMSDITSNYTKKQMASKCGIHVDTLYKYLARHPEINDIISTNLQKTENTIRIHALKSLYARIAKSDKALQIALEKTHEYTPKQDISQHIDNLKDEDIVKYITNSLRKLRSGTKNIQNNNTIDINDPDDSDNND